MLQMFRFITLGCVNPMVVFEDQESYYMLRTSMTISLVLTVSSGGIGCVLAWGILRLMFRDGR